MTLTTKINLALAVVFLAGLVITGYISRTILLDNAKREVITHAGMMMESALAARAYTINEIKPLLVDKLGDTFLHQTVPSYAATQEFNRLRETQPEYWYKEATLNPTNPRDRSTEWETDIIQQFRKNSELTEIIGERETPTGPSLYLARPIRIKNTECLVCHGVPGNAPETMKVLYGTANGFGWQQNEVVGSQIVSVPLSVPFEKANYAFRVFIVSQVATFAVIFLVLNVALRLIIIRPVRKMAMIADQVSSGDLAVPEFRSDGKDEIAQLGHSFNRMRRSVEKAMEMMKH
jgi:HAMP domain-containing protein